VKITHLLASLAFCPPLGTALELTGTICGPDEEPIPNLEVTFTTPDERVFTSSTRSNGDFSVVLPNTGTTEGILTVDPVSVIEQGFVRPPEFTWSNNTPPQIPVIELEEITPELVFERRPDGSNSLHFTFDWVAGAIPKILRTYCVERSSDLISWEIVMNVGMACPPVEFIDETVPDLSFCYYRIRPLDPIDMVLVPWDGLGLIGDPAIMLPEMAFWLTPWPGNVVTINSGLTLDARVPIIAPEIRLVPDPGE
jgi:hypothetical protein